MKILNTFPPNYLKIRKAFPKISGVRGILYCWGDTLHNPSGIQIPPQLIEHEKVHSGRQLAKGPDKWWEEYIESPPFRFVEELHAHRREYETYPGSDKVNYLDAIADRLSGPLYGNMCKKIVAIDLICRSKAQIVMR